MGDHTFAVLARDLYGGPSAGVAPPNPRSVTASGSQLTVQLRRLIRSLWTQERLRTSEWTVPRSQ